MVKLKQIKEGDFDPSSQMLTITGKDSIGRETDVLLKVEDRESFLGWIAGVLFEKDDNESGRGIVVSNIGFGIHERDGEYQMSITLQSGTNFRTSFLLPMGARAQERVLSIQAHLEQALLELESFEPVDKH